MAEYLGMPDHAQKFLKAIYRNPTSKILVNGFLSNALAIRSGVRQGCPLSPLIFTLVAELLNQNLIKDSQFKGFKIRKGIRVKVVAYADDTVVPITKVKEARRALKIIRRYEQATASKINMKKSEFLTCKKGNLASNFFQSKGLIIKSPGKGCRYLGFYLSIKPNYNRTWDLLLEKITKELKLWNGICTSIYGRVLILKSKGLGKLWYTASILPLTPYAIIVIKKIQKECTNFFWSYRGHKLRYSNLTMNVGQGGFKLWNLLDKIKSLQIKWMIKFENPK